MLKGNQLKHMEAAVNNIFINQQRRDPLQWVSLLLTDDPVAIRAATEHIKTEVAYSVQ